MIEIGDTVIWNDCGAKQIPSWKGFVGKVIGKSRDSDCLRVKWQKLIGYYKVNVRFLEKCDENQWL